MILPTSYYLLVLWVTLGTLSMYDIYLWANKVNPDLGNHEASQWIATKIVICIIGAMAGLIIFSIWFMLKDEIHKNNDER